MRSNKPVVSIIDAGKARSEKEALLILPGFGSRLYGNNAQKKYFPAQNSGYDIFIPDYISRKTIDQSLSNVEDFIALHHLHEYKKLHIFSYIIGSWVLNRYITKHPENNIASIIYDRSPIQERAPYIFTKKLPIITILFLGKVVWEFDRTPYAPIPKPGELKIGILIESRATSVMRKHKRTVLDNWAPKWDVNSFDQPHDDHFYTWLNHDQMYSRFDIIGEELFHFFKHGKFSEKAKRDMFEGDPFEVYKE